MSRRGAIQRLRRAQVEVLATALCSPCSLYRHFSPWLKDLSMHFITFIFVRDNFFNIHDLVGCMRLDNLITANFFLIFHYVLFLCMINSYYFLYIIMYILFFYEYSYLVCFFWGQTNLV